MIGESYNFLISGLIKTSLLYFLALISAVILFLELTIYKNININYSSNFTRVIPLISINVE